MALALADRVNETTTTTGLGTLTLAGAVSGYQSFSAIGNGNTTYYTIVGQTTSEWEVGIGTYTSAGTTLSRDTVLASSAGGTTKVTLSAGTKFVFCDYPAGKAVYQDASGTVNVTTVESRLGSGFRSFMDGSASISSQLYFANAANSRAWNWQLDASSNAALWQYDGTSWAQRAGFDSGSTSLWTARLKFKSADAYTGGTYAVIGLDWGGVAGAYKDFTIYDYVNGRSMFSVYGATRNVDIFGTGTAGADFRAPIFYDSDNTAYYLNPAGNSYLGAAIFQGGPYFSVANSNTLNSGYTVASDGADIWINYRGYNDGFSYFRDFRVGNGKGTQLMLVSGSGAYVGATNSFRAPIFYDSDDTGYYLDPNSTGSSALRVRGGALFGPNTTWSAYLSIGTNGNVNTAYGSVAVSNGNLHMDSASGYDMYLNFYAGNNVYFGLGGVTIRGGFYSDASLRANLFYDQNNTAYYVDPASGSNINTMTMAGTLNMWAGAYDGLITFGSSAGWRCGIRQYDSANAELRMYASNALGKIFFATGYDGASTTTLPTDGMMLYSNNVGIGNFSASNPVSKLHVKASTPSGLGTLPSGVVGTFDSSGNNYLLFRNTSDNGTYSGIAFQDNNVGGYVIFGNAGGGGDLLYIAGYGGGQLQYGSADSIDRTTRTTVASWNSTGLQVNSGDFRAPIFYDSNDTAYYVNPNSYTYIYYTSVNAGQEGPGAANSSSLGLVLRGNYNSNTWAHKFHKYDDGAGVPLLLSWTVGAGAWTQLQSWGTGAGYSYTSQVFGSFNASSALYSPIFYDSNNTGYYVDPASTSNLNVLSLQRAYAGFDAGVTNSFSCSNWFRSNGSTGWYNESYAGGIYMADSTYVRTYGGKQFYCDSIILAGSDVRAPIFYDSNDTTFYLNPNGYSQINGAGSVNSSATAGLSIYSTGGSGAIMAYHRGGYFAINLGLDSDNVIRWGGWSASSNRLQMDMSGNLTMAGNVTAYSDIRIKTDILVIENALEKVSKIRGVTFVRTDEGSSDARQAGVIAQEVELVLPEVVSEDNLGIKNVAYGNMAGLFIEAIKELKAEIEQLKLRVH